MSAIKQQTAPVEGATRTEVGVEAKDEGVLASLGITPSLFLFQLINLTLAIGIVWFLILKPLVKKMEERKQLIDESLDKAKEIDINFAETEKQMAEKLAEAKAAGNILVQDAHKEAAASAARLLEKAQKDIDVTIEKAQKATEAERKEMQETLRRETIDLVVLTVEKIIGEKMDVKKDEAFIQDILKRIK